LLINIVASLLQTCTWQHTADHHLQQKYIATQQGWRESDYLVTVVGAKQLDNVNERNNKPVINLKS
jgi:hypothetical protein